MPAGFATQTGSSQRPVRLTSPRGFPAGANRDIDSGGADPLLALGGGRLVARELPLWQTLAPDIRN
jgi:hypothetical protein